LTGAVTVIATITLLTVSTSYLSFRFRRLRPLLEGAPLVLLEDGRPIERNMRRERITIEELRSAARQQQIGSLDGVRLAILETDGRISFIPAQ
ncbi:MAG TPA: YetF domain-containing protein, partial [Solirubrobacteraceae bacterium]|nr:YetF domain-containing protein [Solirubrobacteraceae bacterium]